MSVSETLNMVCLQNLFFSAAGGMGPIATAFYKRLAFLLLDKSNQSYNLLALLQFKFFTPTILNHVHVLRLANHSWLLVIFHWQLARPGFK